MRVSFSKVWGPVLLILGTACTVKTVDSTPDGGTGGAGGSGGSAGASGSGGSAGASDSGADTTTGGAGGSTDGGSGGSAGTAGSGGSAGTDGGTDGGKDGAGGSTDGGTDGSAGSGGAAGSGGSAGSGGAAGAADGGTDAGGDPCAAEATPNEDRDHATVLALSTPTRACLQTAADVDFYEFTIPATPVQGGFIKLQITDVSTNASVGFTTYAAADNGEFQTGSNATEGGSVFAFFAGKAGAKFRVRIARYIGWTAAAPYTITASYTGVNDVNEPNDDNATATNITIGTPVQGYLFAGHEVSTKPADTAWEDRFKVTVPQGMMTFTLAVPPDIDGQIKLYNALGSEIASKSDPSVGSTVVLQHDVEASEAGVVYIGVHPYIGHDYSGSGSTTFSFWTTPYTLTVTGP